jgi:hypothetical protein
MINASWSYGLRNKIKTETGNNFIVENLNSNSSIYRVQFEQAFTRDGWTISPYGSWMWRTANSYNPPTFQFVPAKTRWGAGLNVTRTVNQALSLKATVERIWVQEKESPDRLLIDPLLGGVDVWPGSGVPALSYTGWLMALNATYTF